MDLSVPQIVELLSASKLYSPEMAKGLCERWRDATIERGDRADLFLQWLVQNAHITDYQATMLSRGYSEGYFVRDYKILERVGRGKMAGVYKAIHSLGQIVAIKVLPPSRAKEPLILGRFQREAQLALRLKHPNIVRTFQTGEVDDLHYLVMEFLEGETLEEVLNRRKKLPPLEALRLTLQVLLGLQHLHEQEVVHRDLKPANLMVMPAHELGQPDTTLKSDIKIFDIGLGRTTNLEEAANFDALTGTGVVLGTPDYMAPEQARDAKRADIRADIYSVGCILYHILTGQPPFPGTNLITLMVRHATESVPPLASFGITKPSRLQKVLDTLIAKAPEARYATPAQAAQAIQDLLEGTEESKSFSSIPPHIDAYLKWLETDTEIPTSVLPAQEEPLTNSADAPTAILPEQKGPPPSTVVIDTSPLEKKTEAAKRVVDAKPAAAKGKPLLDGARRKKPVRESGKQTSDVSGSIDVELVSEPNIRVPKTTEPFQLTRRDLIMMAVGAAGALLAVAAGIGLSSLMKITPPEVPGNEPPPEPKGNGQES